MPAKSKAVNTNAKSTEITEDSGAVLGQLREIVFGQAQRQLETGIDQLKLYMDQQFAALQQQNEDSAKAIHTTISKMRNEFQESLSKSNKENADQMLSLGRELDDAASRLSSEIEMSDNSGKDEAKQIHQRMDDEVTQLNKQFNEKVQQILSKLDAVTHELSSSKTDRKTLARLLATMATNLESDETDSGTSDKSGA
ncbi:MAG: hypothetical protein AAGJ37_16875 [Pseudomonadota bacterium]